MSETFFRLKPWLGRPAKMSQSYLNQTVLSIFVPLSMLILMSLLVLDKADQAKSVLMRSCHGLEIATNALASAPYSTAVALNRQTTHAIHAIVRHAAQIVSFLITILRYLILYFLFRYHRSILCLAQLMVQATTGSLAQYSEQIVAFVNERMQDIRTAVTQTTDTINKQLQGLRGAANAVPGAIGINIGNRDAIPSINMNGITDKLAFSLPTDAVDKLRSLNGSVPTLDQIEKSVSDAISGPLQSLSDSITSKIESIDPFQNNSFDVIPVPDKFDSIRFCNNATVRLDWVDRFMEGLLVSTWFACIAMLLICIFISVAYSMYIAWEHRVTTKKINAFASRSHQSSYSSSSFTTADRVWKLYHAIENPWLDILQSLMTRVSRKDEVSLLRFQWFLSYISHPYAWLCMSMGLIGMLFVQIQVWVIRWMCRVLFQTISKEVSASLDGIEHVLNDKVNKYVTPYVDKVNKEITKAQKGLNEALVGGLRETMTTVQDKVDGLLSGMNQGIDKVFSAVPPIQNAVKQYGACVFGGLNQTIHTLTTALNNATFELPKINSSSFAIDGKRILQVMNMTQQLGEETHSSDGDSAISSAFSSSVGNVPENAAATLFQKPLEWIVRSYEKTLWYQSYFFAMLFLFGFSVVIIALCAVLIDWAFSSALSSKTEDKEMPVEKMHKISSPKASPSRHGSSPLIHEYYGD